MSQQQEDFIKQYTEAEKQYGGSLYFGRPSAQAPAEKPQGALTPQEFQQKYGVSPNIPQESYITSVKETQEGYEIEYVSAKKSYYEKISYIPTYRRAIEKAPIPEPLKQPAYFIVGHQSQLEKTFAGISALMGFKVEGIKTTQTPFGAMFQTAISPLTGGFTTEPLHYLVEEPPGFIAGEFFGEAISSYIFGKVAVPELVKGAKVLGKGAKAFAQAVAPETTAKLGQIPVWATEHIYEPIKFSRAMKLYYEAKLWRIEHLPQWRASDLDIFLAKHSSWYYRVTGGIAPGEVSLPIFPTGKAIGMAELRASSVAFDIMQTPRTAGVMWFKQPLEVVAKKSLPHLIYHGGKLSIGYLKEPSYFERTETMLTPLVSQTQVTRMGIIPYMPKAPTMLTPTARALPTISGLIPKVFMPTFTFEREKLRPQTLLMPRQKQREKQIALVIPIQQLAQKQQQKLIQVPRFDKLQKFDRGFPPFMLPHLPRGDMGSLLGGARGKWRLRKHPIPTGQQIFKRLSGVTMSIPKGFNRLDSGIKKLDRNLNRMVKKQQKKRGRRKRR